MFIIRQLYGKDHQRIFLSLPTVGGLSWPGASVDC